MDQLSQDVDWLIENADEVLASTTEQDPLRLASQLRKSFTPTQTRLLCELAELRKRATAKFARAGKMFFTRLGYEQSSSQCIAQYKARRFDGRHHVADLCSGIGGWQGGTECIV